MFRNAIPPAAPSPTPPVPVRHPEASRETFPDTHSHPRVQRFTDGVVNALRGDGPVIAPIVLSLIPSLREWPKGLQIELHNNHRVGGRVYGVGPAAGDADPIHVKVRHDGSFLAAYPGDTGLEYWLQCGDHADSLFDAVLAAVELRNGHEHEALMARLKNGATDARTDAQWLRVRLAEQIEARHPPTLRVMETLVPPDPPPRYRRIDGALLQEIAAMTREAFKIAGGLDGLATHYRVSRGSLGRFVTLGGQLSSTGEQRVQKDIGGLKTNTITAALFAEILKEGEARTPRTRATLARIHNVRRDSLEQLVESDWTPKTRGLELLARERRGRTVPVTHGVLQAIADRVEQKVITTEVDLLAAATEHKLGFGMLRLLVNSASGLTLTGKTFMATPWSPQRAALAIAAAQKAGRDVSTLGILTTGVVAPKRATLPVNADLVLQVWNEAATRRGGLREAARLHDVAFQTLNKYVLESGAPTTSGARLIRAKYPHFRFDEKNPTFPGWPVQPSGMATSPGPGADASPDAPLDSPDAFDAELQALLALPPDSPDLPSDLMTLREEDLLPLSPDVFPPHAKRPRLAP